MDPGLGKQHSATTMMHPMSALTIFVGLQIAQHRLYLSSQSPKGVIMCTAGAR